MWVRVWGECMGACVGGVYVKCVCGCVWVGECVESVWRVCGGCVGVCGWESVWRVCGGCVEGVWVCVGRSVTWV